MHPLVEHEQLMRHIWYVDRYIDKCTNGFPLTCFSMTKKQVEKIMGIKVTNTVASESTDPNNFIVMVYPKLKGPKK